MLKLNNNWQQHIDNCSNWDASSIPSQGKFFQKYISPKIDKKKKVFVIISDALRYESGKELLNRIQQEDRYECVIEPCFSMLPSYTQLGMASLLPHKELSFSKEKPEIIYADNVSTQGTSNRAKILKQNGTDRSSAMKVDDLMKLIEVTHLRITPSLLPLV